MNHKYQLQLKNISKQFKSNTNEAVIGLNNIQLNVEKGEIIGIIGTNGAGKSTLFNAITGTLPIDSGEILVQHKHIEHLSAKQRAKDISRVFQDTRMGTAPRMTVFENLMMAKRRGERITLRRSLTEQNRQDMTQLVSKIKLDLEHRLDVAIESLSGGQRQTITLLMATLKRPEILLLDEHTAALDPRTAKQVMKMTESIIRENELTALMITHQLSDAIDYCDRIVVMHKGTIQKIYSADEVKTLKTTDLFTVLELLSMQEEQHNFDTLSK